MFYSKKQNMKKPILCSACLLGLNTRYDGNTKPNEKVIKLVKTEYLIPVCPEQLGGLPTPRDPQQLQNCSGEDVLDGKGFVKNDQGDDGTAGFIKGAYEVLKIVKMLGIEKAILKQKSPSCGCGLIHDGSFTGETRKGNGVTTALLLQNGIEVLSEDDL